MVWLFYDRVNTGLLEGFKLILMYDMIFKWDCLFGMRIA